ncbi:PDZ domain-containing protein [Rhodococcus sp. IEGM1300]
MNRTVCFAALSLVMVNLSGCVDILAGAISQASSENETPESVGLAPANFRGKTCVELALNRERADSEITYTGEYTDYVRKQGRWRLASVEQVEQEQGCLAGITSSQASAVEYVAKHPEAAKELESKLPPAARSRSSDAAAPSANSSSPAVTADQPKTSSVTSPPSFAPGFGSTSLVSGLPQTSLAQWIAQETPEKYKGKSCEYLRQAYARSNEMLAVDTPETQVWGASKKTAIDQVLSGKDCPPLVTASRGRIGVTIGSLDPVKAARLGMPLKGTSIEKVAPGGNAEKAGLKYADVIVSVDSTSVGDDIEFLIAMGKVSIGSNVLLKVWRKDAFIDIPVLVGPPT